MMSCGSEPFKPMIPACHHVWKELLTMMCSALGRLSDKAVKQGLETSLQLRVQVLGTAGTAIQRVNTDPVCICLQNWGVVPLQCLNYRCAYLLGKPSVGNVVRAIVGVLQRDMLASYTTVLPFLLQKLARKRGLGRKILQLPILQNSGAHNQLLRILYVFLKKFTVMRVTSNDK